MILGGTAINGLISAFSDWIEVRWSCFLLISIKAEGTWTIVWAVGLLCMVELWSLKVGVEVDRAEASESLPLEFEA